MFCLRRFIAGGIFKRSKSSSSIKAMRLRSYAWSSLSRGFHLPISRKNTSIYFLKDLVCFSSYDAQEEDFCEADNKNQESDDMFEEIAMGDTQVLRKLKLLKFEVDVLRQTDKFVPSTLKKKNWEHLLSLKSVGTRKKYLVFLFKCEKKDENQKKKKLIRRQKMLTLKESEDFNDPMRYCLNGQSVLLKIYNRVLVQRLSLMNELSQEIAQHIVFDCSYQEYMNSVNTNTCAIQLLYSVHVNLYHYFPNYIKFCNVKSEDLLCSKMDTFLPQIFSEGANDYVTEKSYLDIYQKDKLVYLTPHCNEPLLKHKPGDVYIIGAFVDKGFAVKASLAKAKEHNLRMARLPIDEFISWKKGSKSLPLNLVLSILLDFRYYNNWPIALENVPRRHYKNDENFTNDFDDLGDLIT